MSTPGFSDHPVLILVSTYLKGAHPEARPGSVRDSHCPRSRSTTRRWNQLSYPETNQMGRSADGDQHTSPARHCRSPDHGNTEQHVTDHEQDRRQSIGGHHTEDDLVMSTLVPADLPRLSDPAASTAV
jgi:hypothetical protein